METKKILRQIHLNTSALGIVYTLREILSLRACNYFKANLHCRRDRVR